MEEEIATQRAENQRPIAENAQLKAKFLATSESK